MAKRKRNTSKQDLNGQAMKRKKSKLQLSNLPKDILCTIMSKLPIKEAVRMRTLSSQWNRIWCCRTNLVFSLDSLMSRHDRISWTPEDKKLKEEEFVRRVDAILQQHSGAGIEKIEVKYSFAYPFANHIDRLVNFAIESRTKQLILDFRCGWEIEEPYNFPFQLFNGANSTNLRYLKLDSISLKQPADFKGFLNLTKLKLLHVGITNEDLQHLLSNCNFLEFLGISECQLITILRITHPSNRLKHLQINECPLLEEIEFNSGLTTLEYSGPLIPLAPPGATLLKNLCVKSFDICGALQYIFTKFPRTLPRLEMLTLKCRELERFTLPEKHIKFSYLKYLRLELTFFDWRKRKTDILDFACILEAAPFMEKLEFHMWTNCRDHLRYRKAHGELRTLPPWPHYHLKVIDITGFYGQKDQLELVLHILRNSVVLKAMKIDPKPIVAGDTLRFATCEGLNFVHGTKVAMKYVRKADHRNVVDVLKVSRTSPFWIKFDQDKRSSSQADLSISD